MCPPSGTVMGVVSMNGKYMTRRGVNPSLSAETKKMQDEKRKFLPSQNTRRGGIKHDEEGVNPSSSSKNTSCTQRRGVCPLRCQKREKTSTPCARLATIMGHNSKTKQSFLSILGAMTCLIDIFLVELRFVQTDKVLTYLVLTMHIAPS